MALTSKAKQAIADQRNPNLRRLLRKWMESCGLEHYQLAAARVRVRKIVKRKRRKSRPSPKGNELAFDVLRDQIERRVDARLVQRSVANKCIDGVKEFLVPGGSKMTDEKFRAKKGAKITIEEFVDNVSAYRLMPLGFTTTQMRLLNSVLDDLGYAPF